MIRQKDIIRNIYKELESIKQFSIIRGELNGNRFKKDNLINI